MDGEGQAIEVEAEGGAQKKSKKKRKNKKKGRKSGKQKIGIAEPRLDEDVRCYLSVCLFVCSACLPVCLSIVLCAH